MNALKTPRKIRLFILRLGKNNLFLLFCSIVGRIVKDVFVFKIMAV